MSSPAQSGLLYPGLQALDEQYLGVDVQFGGVDQRKIFTYAEKYLPKLGYAKRSHLMNPMVPGLTGGKMSSSEVDSKIDLLDSNDAVERKLMTSVCVPSEPDNGVMAFVNYVVFPVLENQGKVFTLVDGSKFTSFEKLKEDFVASKVCGEEIKKSVVIFLNGLLDSIRKDFDCQELKELSEVAYPNVIGAAASESVSSSLADRSSTGSSIPLESRLATVSQNLALPVDPRVRSIIDKKCTCLWEVDVNDRPTISILGHIAKLRDFLSIGWDVIVNVNDVMSHLNGGQVSLEIASFRSDLFIELIKYSFNSLNISTEKIKFVKGSEFQLKKEYVLDLYRMSALVSCSEANEATASVLRDTTLLSGLVFPDMVTLDEKYLEADVHYMASIAKTLGNFAEKHISIVGSGSKVHIYGHTMPSLLCRAPLTPEEEYIELLEQDAQLKKKIKSTFCEEGNVELNPILSLVKNIILPLLDGEKFIVARSEEHGGNLEFSSADDLKETFSQKNLHPGDLKNSVLEYLKKFISPIRKLTDCPAMKKLTSLAYPPPAKKTKCSVKAAGKSDEFSPSQFNMVVGKIVNISQHPDADSLYVEQIDIGEETPRTIVSGLVKYISAEEMRGRLVVVLANLKPQKMRGVLSSGMVLCASVSDPSAPAVEPLLPSPGSRPGERVLVEGSEGDPDAVLNTKKSDALTKMFSGFRTNGNLQATWNSNLFQTSVGPVSVPTLKDAPIK